MLQLWKFSLLRYRVSAQMETRFFSLQSTLWYTAEASPHWHDHSESCKLPPKLFSEKDLSWLFPKGSPVITSLPLEYPEKLLPSLESAEPLPLVDDPPPLTDDPRPLLNDPPPLLNDPPPLADDPPPLPNDPPPLADDPPPLPNDLPPLPDDDPPPRLNPPRPPLFIVAPPLSHSDPPCDPPLLGASLSTDRGALWGSCWG